MSAEKVSFTIRRPTPTPISRAASSGPESDSSSFKVPAIPRHLTNNSSTPGSPLARSGDSSPYYSEDRDSDSDQDDDAQDELVTGFDKFVGIQRLHERKKPQGPLVIPALKNRDWQEAARRRRTLNQYVPESARAQTGADGSVGGLGTKDTFNGGPVVSGLQYRKKASDGIKREDDVEDDVEMTPSEAPIVKENEEDSEDKAALRALLAGVDGEYSGPRVDIIPTPVSEQDAYKQDVEELPEPSSLADYERIPVSQFGAAMLRGMGWKEGTAASRKGNGIVQPYIPESRPALLGIGAKEMETFDDGSKKNKSRRPEKRYIPVVKKDRDGNIISEGDSRPRRDVDKERRRERSEGDSRPKRDVDKERRRERSSSPRRESRVSSRRASPDTRSYDDRSKKDDRDRRDRENGRRDRDRERGDRRDRSRESEKRRR